MSARNCLLAIVLLVVTNSVSAQVNINGTIFPQEAPRPYDNYQKIVFRSAPFSNLLQFDSSQIRFGQAKSPPWNASYWPTQKGAIANRYHDRHFPNSKQWSVNRDYWQSNMGEQLVAQGRIESLSPAEKYDLLVGDSNWNVTRAAWEKGTVPASRWGNVPGWFGFCHGWAAATHMGVSEPQSPVTVVNANGQSITFFANDIKALLTWLWAESGGDSIFIGSKCRIPNPDRDEWGRFKEQACFDNNPMTWHLALLNRLGRDGDSLVMDSSFNNEIWNFPVDSYYFTYFNPLTMKPTRSWEESIVEKDKYSGDPYKDYRDPRTTHIIGVVMEVFFPNATVPRAYGKVSKRLMKSKTFIYDLELDQAMNIIGGEWYSKERPDFIWTYPLNHSAGSMQKVDDVSPWSDGTPLPADLAARAREISGRGKVLARIVNGLLERSLATSSGQIPHEEEQPIEEPGGQEDPGGEPTPLPGVSP